MISALGKGGVAFALLIDLFGRWVPREPGRWMLGPPIGWWAILVVSAVLVGSVTLVVARSPTPTRRRWQLSLAWGFLLVAQILTLGGLFGGPGGWVRLGLAFLDASGTWLGVALELLLITACFYCFLQAREVPFDAARPMPRGISPRPARWPYWIAMPLGSLAYTTYCMGFALEAWGRRGEVKPRWFVVASGFAFPGMFLPVLGPVAVGAAVGFVVVWLGRTILGSVRSQRRGFRRG